MTVINVSMISLIRVKSGPGKWSKMCHCVIYSISPRVTGETAEVSPEAESETGENKTSQTKPLTFATRCTLTLLPLLYLF